jgi:2-polyprenyl-3-methyl-5-hydroxy-6-metoxy-1,4-benzoquinol methylase
MVNPMNDANQNAGSCPICSSAGFQRHKLGLFQCDACGLVLSPFIWQPQANEQLEDEWFGEDRQSRTSFWVALFETWNNRKTISRLAQTKPPGNRLLEIGVGSGSFLNAARERGYEVMGCDLSGPICARVQRVYGVAMHSEPLATLGGEDRFEVIVMNHVLEHVHKPVAFLQDVRRLLVTGGVVHISVPNIACWEAGLSGWTSFEPYHLTYFSPHTLGRTITASGLTIDRIMTHDSFSGWFLALLRTALGVNRGNGAVTRPTTSVAGRASGRRSGLIENAYRLAMVFAGVVDWPLRWLQAKIGRGDEVISIAHKPQTSSVQQLS